MKFLVVLEIIVFLKTSKVSEESKKFSPPAKQRANICSNLIIKKLDRHLWTLFYFLYCRFRAGFWQDFLPALLIMLPRSYFNIFLQVSWNSSTIFWKNTQIRLELLVRVLTILFYFFKRIYMKGWKYPAKTIMCWFTGKFVLSLYLVQFLVGSLRVYYIDNHSWGV